MGMTYSKIERSFWETDEARELTPEEKYFWMYLQTNANVNTLGCYAFRMRKAVDETGYNKDTLEKLLDIMIQRGMILYDATTREVFLLHWGKTNWNRQTATLRAMKADLKEIRSEMIKFKINTQLEKSGLLTCGGWCGRRRRWRRRHTGRTLAALTGAWQPCAGTAGAARRL